jgi:hypothetical protein
LYRLHAGHLARICRSYQNCDISSVLLLIFSEECLRFTTMKKSQRAYRILSLVTSLSFMAILTGAAGCSESSSGDGDSGGDGDGDGDGDSTYSFCSPADTCPPSMDGVDLTTPVSFRTDVYEAYFRGSCGGSGCHGNSSNAAAGLHFGTTAAGLDDTAISQLITQLKEATPEIAPGEKNVVPGDWQNSWLMAKLDGCQSSYGISCNASSSYLDFSVCDSPCGDGMPVSEGDSANPTPFPTTPAERVKVHKVRAWIAQGALDN